MQTKEVSSKKFDAIMAKDIDLGKCPKCHEWGGEITIPMTVYGSRHRKAFVRCEYCGFETKKRSTSTMIYDTENKRFGSPTIEKSLMGAIRQAINDWNGRSENGSTICKQKEI